MNSKKMYFVMLGLIGALCIVFVVGALGVEKVLTAKSKDLVDLKTRSQVVNNQQRDLLVAQKQVKTYADLATIAKTVVPQDKDQAEAVREITNIAAQNNIPQLSSIVFPASTLGGAAASPTSKAGGSLTQLVAVPGIRGVYILQITVTLDSTSPVSYTDFTNFLNGLEQNRRTSQVSNITLQPDAKNSNLVSFSLVVNEYVKP